MFRSFHALRRPRHGVPAVRAAISLALTAVALGTVTACARFSPVGEAFDRATPHERYAEALRDAGLDRTAMGREWLAAGARTLVEAPRVDLPHAGAAYLAADRPSARAYRLTLRRGQRLEARLRWEMEAPGRAFVDLFQVRRAERDDGSAAEEYRHVASADTAGRALAFEARRDGDYVLRIQTELLRAARYSLELRALPTLAFPVDGHDVRAIRSVFGDPRDGGGRSHQGVDIFAPRGTPVLAAAEARVARVGTNRLGGRIIWLREEARGLRLYYAHLDRQLVRGGDRVRPGDTLGLVGNSGNARTTPPHLHFGVYARGEGPLDPHPFLHAPPGDPPALEADPAWLGPWLRTATRSNLRVDPSTEGDPLDTLEAGTPLRAEAAVGAWFRVGLPDGRQGFVHAPLLEPAREPLAVRALETPRPRLDRPLGLVMDTVPAGARLRVLGTWADYHLTTDQSGRYGWISLDR